MSDQLTTTTDVTLKIDGFEVTVPKGTLVIRAAEKLGIQIPRFCDHPLLAPAGACRQCLVDISINGRAFPKPQASCTIPVENGMEVKTQLTSTVADKAQKGIMELLLINHPLDCPVCDKGGECPLQNQAMSNGNGQSRYEGVKRTFEKPVAISSQVLLDRERCVLCARCTRFSEQIAGDPFITLNERGALQQVGIYEKEPFDSYYSGNTVQICPVGALTGATYRFRARPFDLVSNPSACEHCASGCAMRTDVRRGKTLRRLAGDDPTVNEEWNCDKGRWAFKYESARNRITTPYIRDESGVLREASWPEALSEAAKLLLNAKSAAVLMGGRATLEDAYGYSKFARIALQTNDIDFRARLNSNEEREFLANARPNATYKDIDDADHVVLISFEPEDESPIVFLRILKAVTKRKLAVTVISPIKSRGTEKLKANFISASAGFELKAIEKVDGLTNRSVILIGERALETEGLLSSVEQLATSKSAKLGWIPRRAGEVAALTAGAIGNLLPGLRPVQDAKARVDVQTVWGINQLPTKTGKSTDEILKDSDVILLGGVDANDISSSAKSQLSNKKIIAMDIRFGTSTEVAHVILPVASVVEKNGTFLDWQGKPRSFESAVESLNRSDVRILSMLADEMKRPINLPTVKAAANEIAQFDKWEKSTSNWHVSGTNTENLNLGPTEAILNSWRLLLDRGSLQEGEDNLAGTARKTIIGLNKTKAEKLNLVEGELVKISADSVSISAPLKIVETEENIVWVPRNSTGAQLVSKFSKPSGIKVSVSKA